MQSKTLVRYDPEPEDAPTRWQVGYAVVLDDGREVYPVTTVYVAAAPSGAQVTVEAEAATHLDPGIAVQDQLTIEPHAP